MEGFRGFTCSETSKTVKKKRSNRRPRNDIQPDYTGNPSLSSSPPSDNRNKGSSEENTDEDINHRRKKLSVNECSLRASYTNLNVAEKDLKVEESSVIDGETNGGLTFGQSEVAPYSIGNENTVTKVKLKVGGVVCTLHAKSTSDTARQNQKPIAKESPDTYHSNSPYMRSVLQGIPWKDFSKTGLCVGRLDSSRTGTEFEQNVRKSKRMPKRRVLDREEEEDDDDEIRYLEKLKASKTAICYGTEFHNEDEARVGSKKLRKISIVSNSNTGYNSISSRSGKESKKSKEYEDADYVEEQFSNDELEIERKIQGKKCSNMLENPRKEMAVITRRQALQSGKDISTASGLPAAPPRKQKEKLSEVEQQLKKAEAAQRRKMQVEKAAQQSEAEAIRKILGQDSSRKKREDKMKQRKEELAQKRTLNLPTLSSNTVRWIMGPNGTVVAFPDDMGLPTIFQSSPCSYPPPREKCAGPSCSNPYKYRDSRSKLPLCSLQCYKAVQEKVPSTPVY